MVKIKSFEEERSESSSWGTLKSRAQKEAGRVVLMISSDLMKGLNYPELRYNLYLDGSVLWTLSNEDVQSSLLIPPQAGKANG